MPENRDLGNAQAKYINEREKGYYNPLVGGVPMIPPAIDEGDGEGGDTGINKTPQSPGRPVGTTEIKQEAAASTTEEVYSPNKVKSAIYETQELKKEITAEAKKHFKIKRLSKQKKELIDLLCESVIISSEKKDWLKNAKACVRDSSKIESLGILPKINELAAEHDLKLYEASLLYHSNN